MTVLAIDPGLAVTACVLVSDGNEMLHKLTIKHGGLSDEDRILILRRTFGSFFTLKPLEEPGSFRAPRIAVIEGFAMYGLKGAVTNAFHMGRTVQAILEIMERHDWRCEYLPASEARTYITGNHAAKSAQIKAGLELLGYRDRMNEHERDALALALTWLAKQREKEAV